MHDLDKAIRAAMMTVHRYARGGYAGQGFVDDAPDSVLMQEMPSYDPMGNVSVPAFGPAPEQKPIAMENPERVRAAEDAARIAKEIQAFEASKAQIQAQPEWARMMTHAPQEPRAPVQIEGGFIGNRQLGTAPYPVANALSGMAQGAYDFKTAPLYGLGAVFPPAAALGTAIDTAEGVAAGSPLQVAMGAFGTPMKAVRNVIAPLTVASGLTAPDEAEAARAPRLGGLSAALSKTAPKAGEMSLEQAMNIAKSIPARELSPLGFYSHGAETAAGLQQAKGAPDQMAAMLQRYGVKPDEMYATGFANESATAAARSKIEAEFAPRVAEAQRAMEGLGLGPGTPEFKAAERQFKNISSTMRSEMDRALVLGDEWSARPSVTRDEIAAHFKERMPQIEETILKKQTPNYPHRSPEEWQSAISAAERRRDWDEAERLGRAWEETEGIGSAAYGGNPPKFEKYTLPGGENYREVLLKLNKPQAKVVELEGGGGRWGVQMPDGTISSRYYDKFDAEQALRFDAQKAGVTFTSSHWDDPNVLAHLRMADRTGPNGEKILHIEEIQSDWGQKGKKEGFDVGITTQQEKRMQDLTSRVLNLSTAEREELGDLLRASGKGGVPSAPYVTNTQAWTDLALKRALREAAEGGYDKLVWTPGAEQAKRYSLSTHVDRIAYDPELKELSYVQKGVNGWQTHPENLEPNGLAAVIGKEAADKLLAQEVAPLSGNHVLEAPDLVFGGSGMKGYYDKIVPNQLSKLVKKLDPEAKVEMGRMPAEGRNKGSEDIARELGMSIQEINALPDTEKRALIGSVRNTIAAPSLTITPKMREAIMKGQTAYAQGGTIPFGPEAAQRAVQIAKQQAGRR